MIDFTSTGEVSAISELMDYFRAQYCSSHYRHCGEPRLDVTAIVLSGKLGRGSRHRRPLDAKIGRKTLETLMEETAGLNSGTEFLYLEDKQCTVPIRKGADGKNHQPSPISFYGSPWTPEFDNWAFHLPRGQPSWETWAKIPDGTDILVTHDPPLGWGGGTCALTMEVVLAGCYDLLEHVQQRVKPRVQIFGSHPRRIRDFL